MNKDTHNDKDDDGLNPDSKPFQPLTPEELGLTPAELAECRAAVRASTPTDEQHALLQRMSMAFYQRLMDEWERERAQEKMLNHGKNYGTPLALHLHTNTTPEDLAALSPEELSDVMKHMQPPIKPPHEMNCPMAHVDWAKPGDSDKTMVSVCDKHGNVLDVFECKPGQNYNEVLEAWAAANPTLFDAAAFIAPGAKPVPDLLYALNKSEPPLGIIPCSKKGPLPDYGHAAHHDAQYGRREPGHTAYRYKDGTPRIAHEHIMPVLRVSPPKRWERESPTSLPHSYTSDNGVSVACPYPLPVKHNEAFPMVAWMCPVMILRNGQVSDLIVINAQAPTINAMAPHELAGWHYLAAFCSLKIPRKLLNPDSTT